MSSTRPSRVKVATRLTIVGAVALAAVLSVRPTRAQELGDDKFDDVRVVASSSTGDFTTPLDAVPSPDATTVYLVASGPNGSGIFSVSAAAGDVSVVATGAPLVAPRNLVVSADGTRLYVADPEAETSQGAGAIFVVALGGNGPVILAGSEGTAPLAIETIAVEGSERVLFSGLDPASGRPAVMSLPEVGAATPTVHISGDPLGAPDGVVATADGRVFVVDRGVDETNSATVYRLENGALTLVTEGVRPGTPAGIALSQDDRVLAVSSHNVETGTSQVLLIDLETGETGVLSKVIGANRDSGGLHRAKNADIYAWADIAGKVYIVTTRPATRT